MEFFVSAQVTEGQGSIKAIGVLCCCSFSWLERLLIQRKNFFIICYKPIKFFTGVISVYQGVLQGLVCLFGAGGFFGFVLVFGVLFVCFALWGVFCVVLVFCDNYRSKLIFVALYNITLLGSSGICHRTVMSKNCQQKEQGIGFGMFMNCKHVFNFKVVRSHLLQS